MLWDIPQGGGVSQFPSTLGLFWDFGGFLPWSGWLFRAGASVEVRGAAPACPSVLRDAHGWQAAGAPARAGLCQGGQPGGGGNQAPKTWGVPGGLPAPEPAPWKTEALEQRAVIELRFLQMPCWVVTNTLSQNGSGEAG